MILRRGCWVANARLVLRVIFLIRLDDKIRFTSMFVLFVYISWSHDFTCMPHQRKKIIVELHSMN